MQIPFTRRSQRVLTALFAIAILIVLSDIGTAQPLGSRRRRPPVINEPPPPPGIWEKSLVGARLGPWFSDNLNLDVDEPGFRLKSTTTSFHLELFYQPHLSGISYLDLNFGAVSRGDIRVTVTTGSGPVSAFGDATIYPLGVGLMVAPLAQSVETPIQPFVRAGGSVLIGTERLEAVYEDPIFGTVLGQDAETRIDLGFYAGAGIFWVLGSKFALSGSVKYQHANFSEELFGVRDYSGIQVLFGGAYLYR